MRSGAQGGRWPEKAVLVIFNIIMTIYTCFLCGSQRLASVRTDPHASTLDLRWPDRKRCLTRIHRKRLPVKRFPCCRQMSSKPQITLKVRVVTKTCHEDGAFLVG